MSAKNSPSIDQPDVALDTSVASHPRLIVEVPPEQEKVIRQALETLSQAETGVSAQMIVLDALRVAAEQTYFWTPEWQAKEREADKAIAEGRVQTFDTMEEMLNFLDEQ
ncbi:MAG TPA: hypothetical protein VF177_22610 [Anaerolineae bacterium]